MTETTPKESAASGDFASLDVDDEPIRIKRRWPIYVAGLLVLGGIAAAIYLLVFVKTTQANTFVVAVKTVTDDGEAYWWEGDDAAREVAGELAGQLEDLGMKHVGFSKEQLESLESARTQDEIRDIARDLEAGFIIFGEARIVRSAPLDGSQSDFSIELTLSFMDTDTGEITEVGRSALEFFEWATTPTEAIKYAAARMAAAGAAPLVSGMAQHPRFQHLVTNKDKLTYDEAKMANDLEGFFRIAGHYDNQMKQRDEHEKLEKLEHEDIEQSTLERQLLGDFLAEEYYVGAGPDDQIVLLTEPHFVEVRPDEGEYGIRRESERISLTDVKGENRKLLFEHFNFFSFPHISANGKTLAAVIDNRGRSKWLISVNVPDGKLTVLLAHADHYFSTPSVSPDGSRVVYWFRQSRYSDSTLEIIGSDGNDRRELVGTGFTTSWPSWSPDGKVIYLSLGTTRRANVVAIDVDEGTQTFLLGPMARPTPPVNEQAPEEVVDPTADGGDDPNAESVEEEPVEEVAETSWDPRWDSEFDRPNISPDGKFLIVTERDGNQRWVGRFDVETGEYRRLLDIPAKRIMMSPTGEYVAIGTDQFTHEQDPGSYDDEVILVPTDGGDPTPITLNAVEDDLGGWSRDGKAVFIRQSSRDPGSSRYASRVYRYSLP